MPLETLPGKLNQVQFQFGSFLVCLSLFVRFFRLHWIHTIPYSTILQLKSILIFIFFITYHISQTIRNALNSRRRMMSTNIYDAAVRADKHNNVKKKLLSDPATYPLIFILAVAMSGCTGFGLWFLGNNSDVRINTTKRAQIIRDWSKE